MKLGFIGFGEAPHHISRDFVNSDVEVRAFDVSAKDDSPRAQKMREHAAMDQVTLVTDMAELIAWGDVFFCFTSADVALPIAVRPRRCCVGPVLSGPEHHLSPDEAGDRCGVRGQPGRLRGGRGHGLRPGEREPCAVSVCGAKAKEAASC